MRNLINKYKEAMRAKEQQRIVCESERRIQAMEFNGALYLCVDGTPIIKQDRLTGYLTDAVKHGRETFTEYHTNKIMR